MKENVTDNRKYDEALLAPLSSGFAVDLSSHKNALNMKADKAEINMRFSEFYPQ